MHLRSISAVTVEEPVLCVLRKTKGCLSRGNELTPPEGYPVPLLVLSMVDVTEYECTSEYECVYV